VYSAVEAGEVREAEREVLVSVRFRDASLADLGAWLGERGLGLVFAESLGEVRITGDFVEVPVSEVVYWLGRRVGQEVARVGQTVWIGAVEAEDRATYVSRWEGDPETAVPLVSAVLSEKGRCVVGEGVVVVVDSRRVIDRVVSVVQEIRAAGHPVWVVQLAYLRFGGQSSRSVGVEVSASGTVAASLLEGADVVRDVTLSGVVRAAESREGSAVVSCPAMVLLEGVEGAWSDGMRVPVAQKTVSDAGTVSVTGYEVIEVGTSFKLRVYGVGGGRGRVSIVARVGQLGGYVADYPVVVEGSYEGECVCESGGTYLLGQFAVSRRVAGRSGWLARTDEESGDLVQLWARVWRVGASRAEWPRAHAAAGSAGAPVVGRGQP